MPTYAFEVKNVRGGSTDVDAGQDLDLNWDCLTDTATVDAGDVIAALFTEEGIAKGSPHPTYAYARCTRITANCFEQHPFLWMVRAEFKEPRPQPGDPVNPEGGQPEPTDRDPWITGGFRREEVFRGYDRAGDPFVNSAGDQFENPPALQDGIGTLTVTRYYDSINFTALAGYQNKRNNDEWQGLPIDSLLVVGIQFAPHSERGWTGWKVVFNLEYKDETPEQNEIGGAPTVTGGWHPIPVLDVGRSYLDGGTTRRTYDEPSGSNVPKAVPGFLNGVDGDRSDEPKYLGFRIYNNISFAFLG